MFKVYFYEEVFNQKNVIFYNIYEKLKSSISTLKSKKMD